MGITPDRSRPKMIPDTGETAFPVKIDDVRGLVVVASPELYVLDRMVETIRSRNKDYSQEDAVIWAAERALAKRGHNGGVIRLERSDVH